MRCRQPSVGLLCQAQGGSAQQGTLGLLPSRPAWRTALARTGWGMLCVLATLAKCRMAGSSSAWRSALSTRAVVVESHCRCRQCLPVRGDSTRLYRL